MQIASFLMTMPSVMTIFATLAVRHSSTSTTRTRSTLVHADACELIKLCREQPAVLVLFARQGARIHSMVRSEHKAENKLTPSPTGLVLPGGQPHASCADFDNDGDLDWCCSILVN